MLTDQTDYLVIGVLGLQGVGKSTILSLIAGTNVLESNKLVMLILIDMEIYLINNDRLNLRITMITE